MKQNDWTSQLRQRLADSEAPVPDDLWNRIEQQLDRSQATTPNTTHVTTPDTTTEQHRHGATLRFVMWTASVAAAVALLVVIGYRANEDTIDQLAVSNNKSKAYPSMNNAELLPGNTESASAIAMAKNSKSSTAIAAINNTESYMANSAATTFNEDESATTFNEDESATTLNEESSAAVNNQATEEKAETTSATTYQQSNIASAPQQTNKPRKSLHNQASAMWTMTDVKTEPANRITVGVNTGGTFNGSGNSTMPGIRAVRTSSTSTDYHFPNSETANGEYLINGNAMLLSNYKETKHHAQPLSVGLSVGYALNHRLALTSGLVYTRAETDFIKSSGNDDIIETQKLHYIGIPISLKYKIWGNNHVQTYASAGGEADFNVKASLEADGLKTDATHDHVQFSANAALGIQINALPQVGLFAEPGVKYYFNNNSPVETIFKDKPWAFNLQVGVRVDF